MKSLDRTVVSLDGKTYHYHSKIKQQSFNSDGYLTVKLSKDGKDVRIATHILVAKAFVKGYFDGAEVNHLDCDRTNNYFENLEWLTHYENILYAIKMGNHVCKSKDYNGQNNPNYGNHKLSDKYRNDKNLAKQKQGRRGTQNGRCIPIKMICPNGDMLMFDYIGECANYMINNHLVKSKVIDSVRNRIMQTMKNHVKYNGYEFQRIN